MSWNWEELTAPNFAKAVEEVQGVCLVPLGVLEKHGDHLPLGTDVLAAREFARRAVEIEPAIIFPPYYFGQIFEGKPFPGTITTRHELMIDLLDNMCDEIARNGMKTIILLNGHGGNEMFLYYFMRLQQEKQRDYMVYLASLSGYYAAVVNDPAWKAQMTSAFDAHGGETETSYLLAFRPDLVKMEDVSAPGEPLNRLAHLPNLLTGLQWYASYPEHYAGDATPATAEKGEYLLNRMAEEVATLIRSVKADTETERLEKEFFTRSTH